MGMPGFGSGASTLDDLDRINLGGTPLLFHPESLLFD
jgi:hypothetical protein